MRAAMSGSWGDTFDIEVQVSISTNEPPVITDLTAVPALLFPEDSSTLTCTASDPDGDPLNYAWVPLGGAPALDDATARKLREAGLYIVMISLHSHRAEHHDDLLNVPGAFDKVMDAIDNCQRYGMDVILNCTMTHEKVQDGTLWEMVRLARDKKVTVNFVQPCTTGKWADNKGIRMQPEDYEEFDKAMKLPWVVWEGKSNYKENGCRPGLERMYMSNAGDVIPCAFIHLNFGNVRKESVGTIWDRMKSFEYFQETKERCIASNDETFYTEYIEPIIEHEKALFPIEEHPKYQATNPEEASSVIR